MGFIRGAICDILEEDGKPKMVKIVSKKELSSFCSI